MSAERLREDWPFAAAIIEHIRKHRDITPSTLQVFLEVYSELDNPRTQAQLVKVTGISRDSLMRATKHLKELGLVRYERERLYPVNLIKDL